MQDLAVRALARAAALLGLALAGALVHAAPAPSLGEPARAPPATDTAPALAEPAPAPATLPHPTGAEDELLDASAPAPLPAWTATPDFTALRLAYGRRRDFDERCEGTPADEFMPALEQKRFLDAAAVAERWLARCPVDARVHQWAASAYHQAGLMDQAALHIEWRRGLVASVMAGADGRTPETPWRVISVMEEYIVLQDLALKRVRQSLLEREHPLDALDVTDAGGNAMTLYFDPRWHFRRMRDRFR